MQSMRFYKNIILKFTFIMLMVIIVFAAYSQESNTIKKTTAGQQKALNVTDIKDLTKDGFNFWQDSFNGHFAGIDFGFNAFVNKNYAGYQTELGDFMENDFLRSNSLSINIIQQSIGLQKNSNTIGLVTGLGLQLQSFRLNQSTSIQKTTSGRIIPKPLSYVDNQKSKFSSVSLTVPILAEFQIPIKNYANRLYVSGGVFGGFWLHSHTKIKYRRDGEKEKLKTPDDFSLSKFKTGLMFRMGYRWINIFATYELNSFFTDNLGPDLNVFTVGFTLISF